jgi:DNA-binding Lrp family transcriptional regulator
LKVHERQELDDVETAIRDYILENPKKTQNQIVDEMGDKGVCSRITCLNKIAGLEERDIIEDIRAKPNNFSCLIIKDKNKFGLISEQLTKIEYIIKIMSEPTRKMIELRASKNPLTIGYDFNVLFPYIESISTLLRVALVRTNEKIQSKKDSQKLHTRIINLMMKLVLQSYDLKNAKELLLITKHDLTVAREVLSDPGTKNDLVSWETVDMVLKTIQDFEMVLLP